MNSKKVSTKIIIGIILFGIVLASILFLISSENKTTAPKKDTAKAGGPTASPKIIRTNGELVCLTKRDYVGGVSMECPFGIKDEKGNIYELIGISEDELLEKKLSVGSKISVEGIVDTTFSKEYLTQGTFTVDNWNIIQ